MFENGRKPMRRCVRASAVLYLVILVCGVGLAAGAPAERWLPVDEDGWTVLQPAPDSRLIYVSSRAGDDAGGVVYAPDSPAVGADPFKPAGPVRSFKTIAAAMAHARDEHPDWVLLRRGDVWRECVPLMPSGRSATEPFVLTAYGDGPERPQLRPGPDRFGLRFDSRNGFHDIALVGLELYASPKDPESPEFDPEARFRGEVGFLVGPDASVRRVLYENCRLSYCGVNFQSRYRGGSIEQLALRRNLILDNYSRTGHSQGSFAYDISVLLEENVYDHNGWLVREHGNRKDRGGATMFNHNTYFCNCHDVVFRGNMFLRASSSGNKWTANSGPASARNLTIQDNLYVEGEVGISAGGNKPGPLRFANVRILNNVLLHLGRARPTYRDLGWGIDVLDWNGGTVAGNVVVQRQSDGIANTYALKVGSHNDEGRCRNVSIHDNVFYGSRVMFSETDRLEAVTFASNALQVTELDRALVNARGALDGIEFARNTYHNARPDDAWFSVEDKLLGFDAWCRRTGETGALARALDFPDPVRTVETYMASMGLEPTLEAFIAEVRKQSKANWRPEFTARAVNDYVRAGFGLAKARSQGAVHP